MNFEIRPAEIEDMIDVAKLFKKTRLNNLPYLPELHTQEEDINYFTRVVFKKSQVFIAQETDILGFIAFDQEWVHHLYISPDFQGQGIGKSLLELPKQNSKSLKLWTFQKNELAIGFYKKYGFKEIKRTDGAENEEKEPDLLMQWDK